MATAGAFALVSAVVASGAQVAVAVVELCSAAGGLLVVYLAEAFAVAASVVVPTLPAAGSVVVLFCPVDGVFERSTRSRTTQ